MTEKKQRGPIPPAGHYNSFQTAERMQVTEGHLRTLRHKGKGPPFVKVPQNLRVFYKIDDLEKWLSKNGMQALGGSNGAA